MTATMTYTPVQDGFSQDWGADSILFQPMFGPARARRMGFKNPHKVKLTWILSSADYDGFDTFFYTTLAGGSLPFLLSLRGSTKTCRFLSAPQTGSISGDTYVISAQVEILR